LLARGEGWLAVDKPAGIPVHPTNSARENSLIRLLGRQLGIEGLRLVHRLDRETSGVLLVAECAEAARYLASEFAHGRVRKEYLALVSGMVAGGEGTIDVPIAGARGSKVFVRREASSEGQPAVTRWRVVKRLPDRTLVRLFPLTGRRHQLRVHLAEIDHPILGDLLYGREDEAYLDLVREGRDRREREVGPRRHLLHCSRLSFRSPEGSEVEVKSPLPTDFLEALGDAKG
jgi:RluA family pseudouridine synthase